MAVTAVLLLVLVSGASASASDYLGGTTTFSYKGKTSDGKFEVELRNKETFQACSTKAPTWTCPTENCGTASKTQSHVLDKASKGSQFSKQWCESETVSTRILASNRPFRMKKASCCWSETRNTVSDVNLETSVDLGTRSDTKEPNKSPHIGILPLLRVPQNCPRTYNLLSFDPDGDRVRCSYKNGDIKGFQLDKDSCTLKYLGGSAGSGNIFAVEMVVEDFPQKSITLTYIDGKKSTTAALSKLPLQYSVLVGSSAPSCQEGLYLPKLVDPTPANGEHIRAEVDKAVEIKVKAEATMTLIHSIVTSGPQNIIKRNPSQNEFVIAWTPKAEDLGGHFPVCFAVQATTKYFVYQSDMRCVVVDVKPKKTNVICSESSMKVEVERDAFSGLSGSLDHLRLSDSSNVACSLQRHSNSTHVVAVIPLNACGTEIEEDDANLIFKNEITTVKNSKDLITRTHLMEVKFECQYPKQGKVSLSFKSHRENINVWEEGFGTFTYQFEFYSDDQFKSMIDPNSYPLDYDVGNKIYMAIKATSEISTTELFVESCKAAPYDTPNAKPSYSIIDNGCSKDSTVKVHSKEHTRQFQFSMDAFRFIGLHEQVYISCSVLMCEAGDTKARCSKGCIRSTTSGFSGFSGFRSKREAVTQTARHFISQGPLRLRRSAERTEGPAANMNMNMNLVFIAGCLLAAVGMICGVLVYKTRVSRVQYQPLPVLER